MIGRRLVNFASEAEFSVLPLIASVAAPEGAAKVVRRWAVCRLARQVSQSASTPTSERRFSHDQ